MYVEALEVRCPYCNKLAFKALSVHGGEVKCVRCKHLYPANVQATLTDVPTSSPEEALTDVPDASALEVLQE